MQQSTLYISHQSRLLQIPVREIELVVSYGNYCRIMTQQQTFTVQKRIGVIVGMLPQRDFCRVHKLYIVSLKHVSFLEGRYLRVGKTEVPIGDVYYGRFKRRIRIVT